MASRRPAWVSGSAAIAAVQGLEAVDDADQVQADGLVDRDQPLASVGFGLRDELLGAGELAGNATYFDGEIPRGSTQRLPRFVDEFVMARSSAATTSRGCPT